MARNLERTERSTHYEEIKITTTVTVALRDQDEAIALFGHNDENLRLLREKLSVQIVARGEELKLIGEEQHVQVAEKAFKRLLGTIRSGGEISTTEIQFTDVEDYNTEEAPKRANLRLPAGIRPKTAGQRRYLEAIATHPITFGLGPAGTGKTYLAVAMAVQALLNRQIKRIVLTRPAVEAGERLGFLPGDLQAKIDPYLRPLYDALQDMLPADRAERLVEQGTIEVAPLAFMRGRTLNDAFIILDEAQNTTSEQMKMFLTRMGFQSTVVITGDTSQTDLPSNVQSGLLASQRILSGIEGITFNTFTKADVVRHPLVAEIVLAYERNG